MTKKMLKSTGNKGKNKVREPFNLLVNQSSSSSVESSDASFRYSVPVTDDFSIAVEVNNRIKTIEVENKAGSDASLEEELKKLLSYFNSNSITCSNRELYSQPIISLNTGREAIQEVLEPNVEGFSTDNIDYLDHQLLLQKTPKLYSENDYYAVDLKSAA